MQIQRQLMIVSLTAMIVFSGCKTSRDAGADGPARAGNTGAKNSSAGLSPDNYKQERLASAMRGLRYEQDRVYPEETFAAQIPHRGDKEKAEEAYRRGQKMLFEVNDRVAAIGAFTEAVIIAPDIPRYYVALAQALRFKGKMKEALAACKTALALDPDHFEARQQYAESMEMTGDYDAARSAWDSVLDLDPEFGPAHGRLAILSYYVADYQRAWEHLRQAEQLEYDMPSQFRALLEARMPEPALPAAARGR